MPSERYFMDQQRLLIGDRVDVKESEYHHLIHVMRTRVGEVVELVNGRGVLAKAILKKVSKGCASLSIEERVLVSEQPLKVVLAQALPKSNKLDFILEKGTELGVDEFWLFPGDRSAKKESFPSQMERMTAVTIAAMKQCGRLYLPKIIFKPALNEWSEWQGSVFFGDVKPEAPLFFDVWSSGGIQTPILFFVGPESGFSESEEAEIIRIGGRGVKLHDNILRTETAALMGLSLIGHWLNGFERRF
jgi:16S rRNA (uracil1498-N3)-methyltransferase